MSVRARRWALDGAVRAMTATTTTREGWMWARAMTTATATATTRASATMGEGREWRVGGDDGTQTRRMRTRFDETSASRRTSTVGRRRSPSASYSTRGGSTRYTRCEGKTVSGRRWTRWSSSERRGSRFSRRRRIVDGRRAILILSIRRDTSISTIEVERALRVLDGAVLVLCSVGGVQSQSITVDRQMRRYNVPRLCFVNKCDRAGANPWKVLDQVREKLKLNAAAVQIPIGLEDQHQGVVDLVRMQSVVFSGDNGQTLTVGEVPADLKELADEKRRVLIEAVSEVDEELGDLFLMGEEPTTEQLVAAIRRTTIANEFAPLFMGSAYKNRGVQLLLDGVVDYLPAPSEVKNVALDLKNEEEPVTLSNEPSKPLVSLAFKLEEGEIRAAHVPSSVSRQD